ncbi:MAG TPA: ABC transporter substrate-binding protein [Streptosporangiaceae bacterium]|nr:ABC transporter substrate-binding protein [Streptosporangiaceae bacterium]
MADVDAANADCGPDPIKIGLLSPLSPPGDPVAGVLVARGARLGAEYVREEGIAGGRGVRLIMRDDQFSAAAEGMQRSVVGEVAKLAMIDGVTGILGQWHLRTAPFAAALCDKIGVPMFVENGHSAVTASGYRTIFRTYFSIADRVPLMLDFFAEQGFRRLGLLVADTVFGLETADTIERYGQDRHGMEILRFDFPQETTTDVRDQLRKIADFKPDAIVNDAVVRTNYMIINQAAELGLRSGIPMMVTFGFPMRSADFWREAGKAGNGIMWPATRYRPSWQGMTEIGRWFTERYTQRYGTFPPDTSLSAFTDVTLFARAVAMAGSDRWEAVIEALESAEFPTWRGPVRFERGAGHWHHSPPELQIMQYQKVDQSFDEAAVVYPRSLADAPYLAPGELG